MTSKDRVLLSGSSTNSRRASKISMNQSLNHLLNFTLPPRQSHASAPRRSNRKIGDNPTYGVRSTERFVNAQYRFVMDPSGDYTVHFADPDIFFQWHDVFQVIIPRASAVVTAGSRTNDEGSMTCPICLFSATAPRMTKCGHVFCLPCILHYLNVSDVAKWTRCPICFDSVNEKQLKCVKWFDEPLSTQREAGQKLSDVDFCRPSSNSAGSFRMRLIQRPQITTLALPRSPTWPSELIPPHQAPFHFLPDVFSFSKFMLATPAYLVADLTKDLEDLAAERHILSSSGDELGLVFVEAAETKVRLEIQKVEAMNVESLQQSIAKAQRELADINERQERIQRTIAKNMEATWSPEDVPGGMLLLGSVGTQTSAVSGVIPRTTRPRRNVNPPPPSTSTYYYYQSAAGSPIFLHPLDIRILLSHFNSYPAFPDEISIQVEAFSEGSVNADLRKRCKYLALPEGADVVFVEADLESVVGAETLKNFEGALKIRRAKRKEKSRRDDRAKSRADEKEREEREEMYGAPRGVARERFDNMTHVDWQSPVPEAEGDVPLDPPVQQSQAAGAWGPRSFASALHTSPPAQQPSQSRRREDETQDEWDVDVAWHEMQQRSGGRKNGRKQRMVVLGAGAGAARRR